MISRQARGFRPTIELLLLLALAALPGTILIAALPAVAAAQRGRVFTNDDMPASKDTAGTRSYSLQDHGVLQVQIPDSWKDASQKNQVPVTIVFSQSAGAAFQMTINVAWPQAPDTPALSDEEIRKRVESALESVRDQAEEKNIEIEEIKGNSGSGYYFSATARSVPPGEFKHVTQGIYQVENFIMPFTILTNDGQEDVTKAGLAAINSVAHRNE